MVDNEELKLDNNNNNFSLNSLNISNNSLNISNNSLNISSSNCNNISSSNCNNICNNNSTNDLNNSNINLSSINNYDYDNSENLSNNSTATQQQSNNNIGTPTNMTTTFHNNNNNTTINKKISKKPTKTTINKRTLKTTTKVTINHTTKGVSLKNTIISSLALTPAIVCLWWSLWSCIEALPFPGNHFTRAWVIFFGSHVFFIFFFALPQHLWMKLWEKLNEEKEDEEEDDDDDGWKMLTKKKKIKKRKRKKMGMVRLVFSGIASVMMICQWVGCWGLLDWWLGQVTYHDRLLGPEQWQQQQQQQQPQQWLVGAADAHLWLNILISYTLCIFFRFSSNVCCKVSMAERDLPGASFFTSHTRFKCKPSFSLNYLYDSLFSNIFLLSISIHFWRSLWMSYDYYILPQHEVFSSSLGVAVVLAVEFCRFVWISFIGERRRLGAGGYEKEDEREEIEEIEEDGSKQGRNGSRSFKLDMEEAEANGLCSEKLDVDGFVIKEFDFNGLKEEKWDFNGLDLNGLDMGRLNVDGLKGNGLKVDGLKVDGLKVDGFKVDGLVTKKQKSHVELTKGMNGVRQVFVEAVLNGTHNNLHNKNYQHNNNQHNNNQHNNNQHNNNQHNNNRNNNYHYQKNNNNNNQHNNQQSDNHQHNKNSNTRNNNNNNDNNIINNNKIISNNNNNNIIINNNNNNNNNNDDDETLLASSFDTTTPSDSASLEGEDGLIRVNQMVMGGNGMVGEEMVEGSGGVVRDCIGNHVIKVGDSLDVGRRFEEEGASFKSWLSSVVCSLITNLATILYWRSLWNLYTLFTKHTLPPHWVVPCQVLLAIFSFGALYSAGFSQFIARNTFSLDGKEEDEDNEDTFSSQSAIT